MDALTGLNRRREMGFVGTAPRGLLYLFGERYAWARPPCLLSAGPGPSRSFYKESFKMLQAPHEAPSNAVDFDITHRPLPLERSVVYLTSASVRLIRPGSGAFPIHWTGRLSPRDSLRLGPWKLLHRPSAILPTSTSCLTTAAALERRTGSGSWCTQRTGRSCFRNVYR